jgi:hypothetical protein
VVAPFDVTYRDVPDERLSELLGLTNAAGFGTPTMAPTGASAATSERPSQSQLTDAFEHEVDLPSAWELVREREDQAYTWPEERESYHTYRVYAAETGQTGTVHIGLGTNRSHPAWGSDRMHVVAFLSSGSPQIPLVEFQGADDFDQSRELISVIRGKGGGKSKKMFGLGDPLPRVYAENFRTALYSDRIRVRGAWAKVGVVAREDQPEVLLNHALIQARRRGDL